MNRPLIETGFPPEALDRLRAAAFELTTVSSSPERVRVLKHNCAAVFERQGDGQLRLGQVPGYVFRGEIGRLWDAGYQKFWLLGPPTTEPFNEPRRPALSEQLKALHHFSEELKSALSIPSFYNESIGTTNEVSAYDRVRGRNLATPRRVS
jgi:hypothetical protein